MKFLYNILRKILIFTLRKLDMNMTVIPRAPNLQGKMRKYRYVVVNDNNMKEPQIGMAPNPQYLKNLLEATGDKIMILEELPPDGETANYGKLDVQAALQQNQSANGWAAGGQLNPTGMIDMSGMDQNQLASLANMQNKLAGNGNINGQVIQGQVQPGQIQGQPAPQQLPGPQVASAPQPATAPAPQVKEEPKYFTIAGIECKQENGKIYQKQWMRISEVEMANYRLISDKNNKILPMVGKHLEIQKWVLSEDN